MSITEEERAFRAARDPAHLVEVDADGRTHLHLAAISGKAAICRIYIAAGCNPSARDNVGRTPAELAKSAGYTALARSLEALPPKIGAVQIEEQEAGRPLPLDAAEQRGLISGDERVIAAIIAQGRLACRNPKGDTPLHLAAAGGHLTACNTFFRAGADLEARNDARQTPAEMAAEAGHKDLARLLGGPDTETNGGGPSCSTGDALQSQAQIWPPTADPSLDSINFEALEEPTDYHVRQGIDPVSASFTAISSRSRMRSGGPEENDDWELPTSLAKAGSAGSSQYQTAGSPDVDDAADFSHSASSRRSRRPRKLRDTWSALSGDKAETWAG